MSAVPSQHPEIDQLARLLPAFAFEHLIARGRTSSVYKARQHSLDRDVAIKILDPELASDPIFRDSFESERRTMASLAHPNLIRVFDSGEAEGFLYMIMEYVPGKSLFNSAHGKAIEAKQTVRIALSVCRGISHAHGNGVIHRDIRPANILLTPDCEPKIGSFGLSPDMPSAAGCPASGTLPYMAPEIIGRPETSDFRSDIYAVGVMLRELLTGVPAATSDAPAPADARLAAICRAATHPDPASRPESASALADKLEAWLTTGSPGILSTASRPTARPAPGSQKSALRQPAPVLRRTQAAPSRRPASPAWPFVKSSAIIGFLLCAIHLLWGAYQTKKETIARLRQEENAKPPVVKVIRLTPETAASPLLSDKARIAEERRLLVENRD